MNLPGTQPSLCQTLAARLADLNAQINSTQTIIALDQAELANLDPQFPVWTMQGVLARLGQLPAGDLATKYWALFGQYCILAGLNAGVAAVQAAQSAGGCLGNGT